MRIKHLDESLPVIVAAFMTKMPQQRAINLVQVETNAFALEIVGLGDIHGDKSVIVPGHYPNVVFIQDVGSRFLEKLKSKAPMCVAGRAEDGQSEARQSVDQSALALLKFSPIVHIRWVGQVGNRFVQDAGQAIITLAGLRNHPVACLPLNGIPAEPVGSSMGFRQEGTPLVVRARGFESAQGVMVGQVTQRARASQASSILEEDELSADLALE